MLSRFFLCLADSKRKQASRTDKPHHHTTDRRAQRDHLAERIGKYNLMIDCTLLDCLLNITPFFGQFGDIFCNVLQYPAIFTARSRLVARQPPKLGSTAPST